MLVFHQSGYSAVLDTYYLSIFEFTVEATTYYEAFCWRGEMEKPRRQIDDYFHVKLDVCSG